MEASHTGPSGELASSCAEIRSSSATTLSNCFWHSPIVLLRPSEPPENAPGQMERSLLCMRNFISEAERTPHHGAAPTGGWIPTEAEHGAQRSQRTTSTLRDPRLFVVSLGLGGWLAVALMAHLSPLASCLTVSHVPQRVHTTQRARHTDQLGAVCALYRVSACNCGIAPWGERNARRRIAR